MIVFSGETSVFNRLAKICSQKQTTGARQRGDFQRQGLGGGQPAGERRSGFSDRDDRQKSAYAGTGTGGYDRSYSGGTDAKNAYYYQSTPAYSDPTKANVSGSLNDSRSAAQYGNIASTPGEERKRKTRHVVQDQLEQFRTGGFT